MRSSQPPDTHPKTTTNQRSLQPNAPRPALLEWGGLRSLVVQRVRREPVSLSARDVLQLQRTIGNGAVGQLYGGVAQVQAKFDFDNVQDNADFAEEVRTAWNTGRKNGEPFVTADKLKAYAANVEQARFFLQSFKRYKELEALAGRLQEVYDVQGDANANMLEKGLKARDSATALTEAIDRQVQEQEWAKLTPKKANLEILSQNNRIYKVLQAFPQGLEQSDTEGYTILLRDPRHAITGEYMNLQKKWYWHVHYKNAKRRYEEIQEAHFKAGHKKIDGQYDSQTAAEAKDVHKLLDL